MCKEHTHTHRGFLCSIYYWIAGVCLISCNENNARLPALCFFNITTFRKHISVLSCVRLSAVIIIAAVYIIQFCSYLFG
jgi:hypothetical protein